MGKGFTWSRYPGSFVDLGELEGISGIYLFSFPRAH